MYRCCRKARDKKKIVVAIIGVKDLPYRTQIVNVMMQTMSRSPLAIIYQIDAKALSFKIMRLILAVI